MTVLTNDTPICFIDFETTGIDVFEDEPIEFGAVLVNEHLEIINTFFSRIKPSPERVITASAFKIHNISLKNLQDSPSQQEVLKNFFDTIGTNFRLAGWNIGFDITFFRRICHDNNMMDRYNKVNHRHIDIQSLNYLANALGMLSSKTRSLSDLASYYHFERSVKHSALEDAQLAFLVYKRLLSDFSSKIYGLINVDGANW